MCFRAHIKSIKTDKFSPTIIQNFYQWITPHNHTSQKYISIILKLQLLNDLLKNRTKIEQQNKTYIFYYRIVAPKTDQNTAIWYPKKKKLARHWGWMNLFYTKTKKRRKKAVGKWALRNRRKTLEENKKTKILGMRGVKTKLDPWWNIWKSIGFGWWG